VTTKKLPLSGAAASSVIFILNWYHMESVNSPQEVSASGRPPSCVNYTTKPLVGGLNFLSREHGFSCDNIYGYEVVLANGSVVHATASSNSDLWLALKGGSNNFGIVTRFDLTTFQQGLMWGGLVLFNYTDGIMEAESKALSTFMDPANFDSAADMAVILNFAAGSFLIGNSLFYTKPIANPPVYQPFTSLPSPIVDNLGFNNVSSMVTKFGDSLPSTVNLYDILHDPLLGIDLLIFLS
jgi:hypothetical protein